MKFKVKEINESEREAFNKTATHPVQSWEWGEFRKKTGNRVIRLGLFSGKGLIEGYQLTIHRIPYTNFKLGVFLKGPKPSKEMLGGLREFAQKEHLIFIRIEPNVAQNAPVPYGMGQAKRKTKYASLFRKVGARPGRPFFTKSTFLLDLTKPEEELLKTMHPKTRYNIKVAQKHGVWVLEDNLPDAFEKYLTLLDETTRRQGFYAHTERYHRLMWESLYPSGIAKLLVARYQGEIIAAWILFIWKGVLYYPYGASTDKYKNTMANYAMMWEAIRLGKKLGLATFDLWGREEGKGFTRFKEGFLPKAVEFLGTWDLVINPHLYMLYRIAEEVRWKVLKLPLPLPKPRFR